MRLRFARFLTSRAYVRSNKFSIADCVTGCPSRFNFDRIRVVAFSQGPELCFAIRIATSLAIVFVNFFNVLHPVRPNPCLYALSTKIKVPVSHLRMLVKHFKGQMLCAAFALF